MTLRSLKSDGEQEEDEVHSPIIVCAWCKTVFGSLDDDSQSGQQSHGICSDCYTEQVESLKR
jgi:hypothetical protein